MKLTTYNAYYRHNDGHPRDDAKYFGIPAETPIQAVRVAVDRIRRHGHTPHVGARVDVCKSGSDRVILVATQTAEVQHPRTPDQVLPGQFAVTWAAPAEAS